MRRRGLKLTTPAIPADVMNKWSYTSIPQYVHIVWCLAEHQRQFYLQFQGLYFIRLYVRIYQHPNYLIDLYQTRYNKSTLSFVEPFLFELSLNHFKGPATYYMSIYVYIYKLPHCVSLDGSLLLSGICSLQHVPRIFIISPPLHYTNMTMCDVY
jgi:hypothetical protein